MKRKQSAASSRYPGDAIRKLKRGKRSKRRSRR
jgi:hypothetical protein